MIGFQDEFENLPIPNTTKEHSYSAVTIKGFENHRIAKNFKENPCILISVTQKGKSFKVSLQKLYNLSITHNLTCEINIGTKKEEHNFSVIRYSGNDEDLKKYFLQVCEILVPSLGNSPDNKQITHTVNKFIELFKVLKEPPKKTLQGLWSELFLIHQSNNPKKLVKAWHIIPEEKYDFSLEKLRIEVKSSSPPNRTHHFSLGQFLTPSKCELYIASLFIEILAGGKSVEDLLNEIIEQLDQEFELIEKLNFITYSTLGGSVDKIKNVCYDYQLAKESLQIYHSNDIPKIESIPSNVFDVRFKSSIDSVKPSEETIDTLLTRVN